MTSSASLINDAPLLLALNNCEERLQAVLGTYSPEGCTLVAAQEWTVPGRTVQFMIPGIASMFNTLKIAPSSLRRIACTRGPGSFTGLRLALSAAAGIAAGIGGETGSEVEKAGVDYLPLLAEPAVQCSSGPVWVLTHARRKQVYIQGFGPDLRPFADTPHACGLEEAAEIIRSGPPHARLLGTGIRNNRDFFQAPTDTPDGPTLLPDLFNTPLPEVLLHAAAKAPAEPDFPAPMYIRASDAEDNLGHIARSRGVDPDEARRFLEEFTSDNSSK